MTAFVPFIVGLVVSIAAAYFRMSLRIWTIAGLVAIAGAGWLADSTTLAIAIPLVVFALIAIPLNVPDFRRKKLSAPVLAIFQKVTPPDVVPTA